VAIARGTHPIPFRTRKLSPAARMVLPGGPGGRVRRRRSAQRRKAPTPLPGAGAFRTPATRRSDPPGAPPPCSTTRHTTERTRRDDPFRIPERGVPLGGGQPSVRTPMIARCSNLDLCCRSRRIRAEGTGSRPIRRVDRHEVSPPGSPRGPSEPRDPYGAEEMNERAVESRCRPERSRVFSRYHPSP
jgi:hypothetical protein